MANSATGCASGGGEILQIVYATKVDTFTLTSATMTDVPGLSVTITPSSATSKILILSACCYGSTSNAQSFLNLVKDGSALIVGDTAGSRTVSTTGMQMSGAANNNTNSVAISYLDSPASTIAITYKIQVSSQSTVRINYSIADQNSATNNRSSSTILAMEISG